MYPNRQPDNSAGAAGPPMLPQTNAPSIPNLLSRLGPPRAGRGGRRGGWRRGGQPGGIAATPDHNRIIQSTDTDAALSRLSAVNIGLLEDPFAPLFACDGSGLAPRRLPIINRGTYSRTQALDRIIAAYLDHPAATGPRQIVSLGAGTDTRCLRLCTRQHQPLHDMIYHEIDFPAISAKKRSAMQSVPPLRTLLAGALTEQILDYAPTTCSSTPTDQQTGASWCANLGRGNKLWGHGIDLRQLAVWSRASRDHNRSGSESAPQRLPGLLADVPTLLVSECCLCYLSPDDATAVLQYFVGPPESMSDSVGVVLYEPIHPNDAFGRTMVANLAARGIDMPTLTVYPDGKAQEARLRSEIGLSMARHLTMDVIWDQWVSATEKARVNQLDGLDEVEEWKLLASHYVVAWGSRGAYFASAWSDLH